MKWMLRLGAPAAAAIMVIGCSSSPIAEVGNERDEQTEAARTQFIENCDLQEYCTAMLDCVEDHLGREEFALFLSEHRSVTAAGATAVTGTDRQLRRCIVGY